jgi:transcription termination factor Rho
MQCQHGGVSPATLETADVLLRDASEIRCYFALIMVEEVNFEHREVAREKLFFEYLTPLYPMERLVMERDDDLS